MLRGVFRVLLVLWAGSLWSTVWVAATVFHFLADRHLAGAIAARLFSIETYLGLAVAALALLLPDRGRFRLGFLAVALLAVNEWILTRWMSLAQAHGSALGLSFGAWHGIAALVYLLACLCVLAVVYKGEYRNG
ncbi:MAG TPA: DUF4149 domain-containing protein [Steroidobacteraceae bacterium]|jgi:hypothetical protein